MKCNNCGYGNDRSAKICGMCNTRLRRGGGGKGVLIALLSLIGVAAVAGVGFLIFNLVDFDNVNSGSSQRTSVNADDFFFINQSNNNTMMDGSFVTAEAIYFAHSFDGEVTVFDHDLTEIDEFSLQTNWSSVRSLHVTEDAIYYTAGFEGALYRYDRETGRRTSLAEGVFRKVIIGNQVFYVGELWGSSNLYVYDLEASRTTTLFTGDVRNFFVVPAEDTILMMTDRALYQMDLDGGNLEQISDDAWSFAFDGEIVAWVTLWGDIHTLNVATSEEGRISTTIDVHQIVMTENHLFVTDWGEDLYLIERDDLNRSTLIAESVMDFIVVGEHIIYEGWQTFNVYVADFDGNSRVLIEDEFSLDFDPDFDMALPERVPAELSVPEEPVLWDFSPSDTAFMNQANHSLLLADSLMMFVAEEAIYMALSNGEIIRTTDTFDTYETLTETNAWLMSIHVIDGVLYYETWDGDLYRHDVDRGRSEVVASEIFSPFIVNELVFHLADSFGASQLFVYNLETGEREVVLDRNIRHFVIDAENDRLLFVDDTSRMLYQSDLNGDHLEEISSNVRNFAFNGEIIFAVSNDRLYIIDADTHEQRLFNGSTSRIDESGFVGRYALAFSWDNDFLYLIDLDDLNNYWVLADDVNTFATVGNEIIYAQWENNNDIFRRDLFGEYEAIRSRWSW